MQIELIPQRWLEYEPPGLCHTGLETLFGLGTAAAVTDIAGGAGLATLVGAGEATLPLAAGVVPTLGATTIAEATGAAATGAGIAGTGIGIGDVLSGAGTLISMKSGMDNAAYQAAVAKAEAEALKQRANEEAAAGQRAAETKRRQAALVGSRARALAASSGTLATDPTEVNLEEDIAGQGEYNALSALYEGMAAARSSQFQADINLFKARRTSAAAPWAAAGTLFSGLSGMLDRRSRSSRLLSLYGA